MVEHLLNFKIIYLLFNNLSLIRSVRFLFNIPISIELFVGHTDIKTERHRRYCRWNLVTVSPFISRLHSFAHTNKDVLRLIKNSKDQIYW